MPNRPNAGEALLDRLYACFAADHEWSQAEYEAYREAQQLVTRVNVCASVLRTGAVPREYIREPTPLTDAIARAIGQTPPDRAA